MLLFSGSQNQKYQLVLTGVLDFSRMVLGGVAQVLRRVGKWQRGREWNAL